MTEVMKLADRTLLPPFLVLTLRSEEAARDFLFEGINL